MRYLGLNSNALYKTDLLFNAEFFSREGVRNFFYRVGRNKRYLETGLLWLRDLTRALGLYVFLFRLFVYYLYRVIAILIF